MDAVIILTVVAEIDPVNLVTFIAEIELTDAFVMHVFSDRCCDYFDIGSGNKIIRSIFACVC